MTQHITHQFPLGRNRLTRISRLRVNKALFTSWGKITGSEGCNVTSIRTCVLWGYIRRHFSKAVCVASVNCHPAARFSLSPSIYISRHQCKLDISPYVLLASTAPMQPVAKVRDPTGDLYKWCLWSVRRGPRPSYICFCARFCVTWGLCHMYCGRAKVTGPALVIAPARCQVISIRMRTARK